MPQENPKKLRDEPSYQESKKTREKVEIAREKQIKRFNKLGIFTNSEMNNKLVRQFCKIDDQSQEFLDNYTTMKKLSHRAYFKILKLARTIADLEGRDNISLENLEEAANYKNDGVLAL